MKKGIDASDTCQPHGCAISEKHGGGLALLRSNNCQEPSEAGANFDFEVRQEALWHWAADRVTPWGKVQRDDYDFSSWTEGASEELLSAGCLYEYARESQTFRSFLVLRHAPKPEHFCGPRWIEFERDATGHIHLARSGWETWLDSFADELIANESFAELLRTSPSKVEKSLDALAGYNLYPKAVELPGRYIDVPGMREVVIQIDWRHYNNKDIGAEMTTWAAKNRPESEPEPDRTGKKRESKVRADLKALSALRIWKLHRRNPWKGLEYIAEFCAYNGCVRESAEYRNRRDRGHAVEPISNQVRTEISDARSRALNLFRHFFPWGKPSNY